MRYTFALAPISILLDLTRKILLAKYVRTAAGVRGLYGG